MTPAEVKALPPPTVEEWSKVVDWREAHDFVRRDLGPHSTALWVDEGRIKRATEGV